MKSQLNAQGKTDLSVDKAAGFSAPVATPTTADAHHEWQSANRHWWEAHPMRYDWNQPVPGAPGEQEWFAEVDRRFFSAGVIPSKRLPFDGLIPFEQLPSMRVLEIGVGMGSHAQLLARHAGEFVGIDLTGTGVRTTRRRLRLFGLPENILQMDAERLAFPDAVFDLIWSWGVIHHTADTRRALAEMRRVLRPGGQALVMVYHRALVPWYVFAGFLRGVLLGGFRKHPSIHALVQSFSDGALARYFSVAEWKEQVAGLFDLEHTAIYGNRAEALPIPAGRIKDAVLRGCPESMLRLWLTTFRQGSLLFTRLRAV